MPKEKTRGGGRYTESEFFGFIRAGLRSKFSRWPPKYDCKRAARRSVTGKGKQKFEYQCNVCKDWFPDKLIQADHITPCGSLRSFSDLPRFVENLSVEVDGYQMICHSCHKIKTKNERRSRATERADLPLPEEN